MADTLDKKTRSETMAKVKSKNTRPELRFRRALFAKGLRYRLHQKSLPGKPDLVFTRYNAVIFVNGCLWHWHGCSRSRMPATNKPYWQEKIRRNRQRDIQNIDELKLLGWRVLVVWECALNKNSIPSTVNQTIKWLNNSSSNFYEIEKKSQDTNSTKC